MTAASSSVLTQPLLDRCRERAPKYDRDNTFCLEDFNELKAAGYLKMAIPKEFGGQGMALAQVARETRLLAQYAPATALCINMHNYWVGTAADLWRGGDKSCEWILKDATAGEVFAAGWRMDEADEFDRALLPPRALAPEALAELITPLGPTTLAIGDGAIAFREALERSGSFIPLPVRTQTTRFASPRPFARARLRRPAIAAAEAGSAKTPSQRARKP